MTSSEKTIIRYYHDLPPSFRDEDLWEHSPVSIRTVESGYVPDDPDGCPYHILITTNDSTDSARTVCEAIHPYKHQLKQAPPR
jgi:hypothetical protein